MENSSNITVQTFTENFLGQEVLFYVLRLEKSFLLWIGTETTFKTLAVAMNTRFVSYKKL